jgi:putative DNA primase/helicase
MLENSVTQTSANEKENSEVLSGPIIDPLRGTVPLMIQRRPFAVATLKPMPSGKLDKQPRHPVTLQPAQTNDIDTLGTFAEAEQAIKKGRAKAHGPVLKRCGVVVLDLDNAINPETGEITAGAAYIIGLFPDALITRSVSGTGLHIWIKAVAPPGCTQAAATLYYDGQKVEFLFEKFVVDNWDYFSGSGEIRPFQAELNALYADLKKEAEPQQPAKPVAPPRLGTSNGSGSRERAYLLAALRGAQADQEATLDGQKHERRIKNAKSLAGWLHTGYITEQEIIDALSVNFGANKANALKAIRDGIEYGKAEPREIPEPDGQGIGGSGGYGADEYINFQTPKQVKKEEELQHYCHNNNNTNSLKTTDTNTGTLQNPPKPNKNTKEPDAGTLQNLQYADLLPLAAPLRPVAQLDPELIPEPLRPWLRDISERQNVPLDYPTVAAVVALSSVIGRAVAIRPKKYDEWDVIPNLWGAITGPPGVQKTPSTSEAHKPLNRLVADAMDAHEAAKKEFAAEALMIEARKDAAKKKLHTETKKNQAGENELRELANLAANVEELPAPVAKRYVVNDSTVEALGERLKENPRGLLLNRDELTGFFKSLDKQGHEGDRAFYLEAWNGTGTNYMYDRIGRGTVRIPSVTLSIFGTIQPGPLLRYVRQAASGENADGLLPRFQMLVYPDVTSYKRVDRWPDADAKNRAYQVFRALDELQPANIGAQTEEGTPWAFLRFADNAQTFFNEWLDDLEARLREGNEGDLMQAHLAKYRSLMPSLALIFHLVDVVNAPAANQAAMSRVSLESAQRAASWCNYLEGHARRIYQLAYSPDVEAASVLKDHLPDLPNPFRVSQIPRKGWSKLTTGDEVHAAVEFLAERNYLRIVEAPASGVGGRPTADIWINPAALQTDTGEVF